MNTVSKEISYIIKRNKMLKELEVMAEEKGFIKVESDFFEDYLTYSKINQTQNLQNLIKVQDLNGNVFLLKPDVTTNIIKQVIPKCSSTDTVDLYYLDTVFRFDSLGRIKTIRQFGVEVIGRKDIDSDIKLIQLIAQIFKTYQLDYFIEIGNQKFISIVCDELKLSIEQVKRLRKILLAKNIHELKEFLSTIDNNDYDELLISILSDQDNLSVYKDIINSKALNNNLLVEIERLETIERSLGGVNSYIDLSITNEFDYYNGPIYKGYINNYNKEILSGGRYDYLTKEFGKETPALGFTLDLGVLMNEVLS